MEKLTRIAAVLLAAGALSAPAMATAGPTPSDSGPCFFTSQWKTWSAPDDNTILLRLNNNSIYKIGVTGGAKALQHPGTFLFSEMHGNSVCSHMDLQLSAVDNSVRSFRTPLIARSLVKLTPEEVAAYPKKDLPGL